MCGIAGTISRRADRSAAELASLASSMGDTMRHRGPDGAGTWVDERAGVALAHRRLAIIDLTDDGAQPMTSADGRWVLTYNGEVYDHDDHRRSLQQRGVRFRGASDTEVLVEAIAAWGPQAACERTDGMFAFAAWDRQERRLWLARDRFGEKPLYYGEVDRALWFGSQLAPIERGLGRRLPPDVDALGSLLRWKYIPEPLCALEGLHKLPPGSITSWSAAGGQAPVTTWWSAPDAARRAGRDQLDVDLDGAAALVEEALVASVRRRMVADVPVGAFLSGGIDSTSVVAAMRLADAGPVRTYTIGVEDPDYNEADAARAIAEHLDVEHTEAYVTETDALELIPQLPTMYDEPFADSSQLPTALVSAMARQHVTVALTGDGGDELFGGYNRHFWSQAIEARLSPIPAPVRSTVGRAMRRVPQDRWQGAVNRAAAVGLAPEVRRAGAQAHKFGRLLEAGDADAAFTALLEHWPAAGAIVLGADVHDPPLDVVRGIDGVAARAMLRDTLHYLPGDILHKVDRAAMAVSLETRVPFLTPAVFDLAWRLPDEVKVSGTEGKRALRAFVGRHVPTALTDQPKTGFGVPMGRWLRTELKDWAERLLHEVAAQHDDVVNAGPLLKAWHSHLTGDDRGLHLWDALALLAWLDHRATTAA